MSPDATLLVARSLARSWRRYPLRAWSTAAGAVVGIMLATLMTAVLGVVLGAVRGGTAIDTLDADLVVAARSVAGIDAATARSVASVPGVEVAVPVINVSTRVSNVGDTVLAVVGVGPDAARLAPDLAAAIGGSTAPHPGTSALLVGAGWADDHGLGPADRLTLSGPQGTSAWTITGVVPGDLPNGGAIAIGGLEQVASAFGRPATVDAVYVQAAATAEIATLADELRAATGGTATVGSPSAVIGPELSTLSAVRRMLVVTGFVGFATAATVLFVGWRLLLEDERSNLARMRLAGATPRQLATGSGLVFGAATLVCALIGVTAGLIASRFMEGFAQSLVGLTGLAADVRATGWVVPAAVGLASGVVMGGLAWGLAMRTFIRIPPIEAIRGVPPAAVSRSAPVAAAAAGVVAAGAAVVGSRVLPPSAVSTSLLLAMAAVVAFAIALPPVVGRFLAGRGGFVAMAAGRELSVHARRSSRMISMFAIAVTLAIGLSGMASSLDRAITTSVEAWTRGDLFVIPSEPGTNLRDEKFSPDVADRLADLPGVAEAGAFTYVPLELDGRRIQLYAWDTEHIGDLVRLDVTRGAADDALWSALDAGEVAISTNLARLRDLDLGDAITLPGRSGTESFRIAAVVDDATSDGGIVFASLDSYRSLTGDQRLFDVALRLEPGASRDEVAGRVRTELSEYPSLAVWTGAEMRDHLRGLVAGLLTVLRVLGLVSFGLAVLVAATTAAAGLAARRTPLGLSRLCGATTGDLRRQLGLEAVLIGLLAWAIALPLGLLTVRVGLRAIGAQTGLIPDAVVSVPEVLLTLPVAVLAAALAVWIPSRRLLAVDVIEAVRCE